MDQTVFAPRRHRAPTPTPLPGHRADIDGLRALAIILVVVYHVWLGRVSGGVDVFLMISAFFLTTSFVKRLGRDRPLALGAFWLRRFRRLLPAAAVTIAGVLLVALLGYPQTEWPRIWREGLSSLLYVENWTLALSEVDYYARESATPSPFQHFWSLSVQGQVFVLWPLLFAAIWLLFRRRPRMMLPALFTTFGGIFAVSLAFSIVETATMQTFAYFDTRTRLWEFAAGSLVALVLPYVRLPAWVRVLLGWLGVAGIVVCGIVIDVQGGFPGYLALWPVVCTALVIVSGTDTARGGPSGLLASRPLRFLGRDAYALYLVHWPVLVTWIVLSDRAQPGILAGLGIVAVSFVLAALLSRLVEAPLRDSPALARSPRLGFAVIVASALLVVVPLSTWQAVVDRRTNAVKEDESGGYPGAAQIDAPIDLAAVELPLLPDPAALDDEWVSLGESCDGRTAPSSGPLEGSCARNDRALDRDSLQVLVIGDSHAQQLMSPLRALADENGWGIVSLLKGGCSFGIGAPFWSELGSLCDDWRVAALDYALALRPDAVYVVATRATPREPEVTVEGIEQIADALTAQGIRVIAVRDNPRFTFDMYECAYADEDPCDVPELAFDGSLEPLAERDGVIVVDFRPWLCPDGMCRGEIGNVALYIDDNHLSDAYGRTLAPMLGRMLREGGLPASHAG